MKPAMSVPVVIHFVKVTSTGPPARAGEIWSKSTIALTNRAISSAAGRSRPAVVAYGSEPLSTLSVAQKPGVSVKHHNDDRPPTTARATGQARAAYSSQVMA